ncbi:putative membrane protein [Phyllobacterium trifolii]|uniref:Putative membrane protein n=1 Tax=Phyllobacterium trifolii TaxID=300193 RepID=A0A839UIC3_9HYPH|nr:TMEM175 family protein [Phyllobacterium trifolii]MBB3148522.1 putative membrane protein [Phyllobacterium trifolii]
MASEKLTADRVSLFSDGVFAIVITLMVLELRPPHGSEIGDLIDLWPGFLSYSMSYGFLSVVWINHHHILKYAEKATQRLIWSNFAHLFMVSLIPFTTSWVAETDLKSGAVSLYALVFVGVNITYLALCWEAIDRPRGEPVSVRLQQMLRVRSLITIVLFLIAAVIAQWFPYVGFATVVFCLLLYTRPDVSEVNI